MTDKKMSEARLAELEDFFLGACAFGGATELADEVAAPGEKTAVPVPLALLGGTL